MCMGKSLSLPLGLEEHRFTHTLYFVSLSPHYELLEHTGVD